MSDLQQLLSARAAGATDDSLKEVLMEYPGVISFAGGLPDPTLFDQASIEDVAAEVAHDLKAWQYAPTEGSARLRDQIAAAMQKKGLDVTAQSILITSGSQQALDLVAKAFVDPGDPVLIETPGYIGGIQTMKAYEAQLLPAALDDDGLLPEQIRPEDADRAKLLYTVSTFQNPTGATLSEPRRRQLVELAQRHNFLIVEDGAYVELAYDSPPPPPLAAFAESEHAILLGSFSKALLPGIRIGWIVAAPWIIERLALLKQGTDLATNTFGQRFVEIWLERFGLTPPIAGYRERRDRALAALERHMPPGVEWNRPQGGFFFWVNLPESIDTVRLLPQAKAAGVSFVPGPAFGGPRHTLRFSFSQVAPEAIEPGVERLATVLHSVLEFDPKRPR